jgi:hypothetical protein
MMMYRSLHLFTHTRVICIVFNTMWGPLMVAQWLRYCATNRKIDVSIPDGVIGIFSLT